MMIYVFHVDIGQMINFDMSVAMSTVHSLKDTIQRLHGFPAANIVLLVSGGDQLCDTTQVSFYSSGTENNPIYMFVCGDFQIDPPRSMLEADLNLQEQVARSLTLPAEFSTIERRAQLAMRMYDLAREEERICERLVLDQHLQQQGWSAVVANLEDLTNDFTVRFQSFCNAFSNHLAKRDHYVQLLNNFGDDLNKLSRIPILPSLMPLAEADFHGFDDLLQNDEGIFSRAGAESVIVVGNEGVADDGAAAQPNQEATIGDVVVTVQDEAASENALDNAEGATSSTTPNKKPKMGPDATAEECAMVAVTTVTVATTIATTTTTTSQTSIANSSRRLNRNLLQWITSKENHNTLQIMGDECVQGLNAFNVQVFEKLKNEGEHLIKSAEQGDIKEIKGLSERLYRLDEFKHKIMKMVQDQKEHSTAFNQNQNRAINVRDPSILPDLCASHKTQLEIMLIQQQKIHEYRRYISRAKEELGNNVHARLQRIIAIESAMNNFDNRLLFYHRCMLRADKHLQIIEQIHRAPYIYVAAVTEVVRRKIFSGEFRRWASKLSEDFDSIHREEIQRRQFFNESFEGHFLNILFPGMSDMPPVFAESPLVFDSRLPNVTKSDIDMLSTTLPDLATQIQLPNMEPVVNFFVTRSGPHDRAQVEEMLKRQVVEALNMAGVQLQHPRLIDLLKHTSTGCEDSETDTETEFEKVSGVVQQTVATSTSEWGDRVTRSAATSALLMQSAETLTDENHASTRNEVESLRAILANMNQLTADCMRLSRVDLTNFRTDTVAFCETINAELQLLHEKWDLMRMQNDTNQNNLQQANIKLQLQLEEMRSTLEQRESDMEELQQRSSSEIEDQRIKNATLEAQLNDLRDKLTAAQQEKEAAVAEAREELIHEHKTEIESLRCRYRLMTSMELSPSDSSLEKIERPTSRTSSNDMIERAEHEAILGQLRASLEEEREIAIAEKMEQMERDRRRLEEELIAEKSRRTEMESSVAALRTSTCEQSPLPRSKSSGSSHKYAVLESCSRGDVVLVLWNARHAQFMVYQDSQSLYFVHGDSLETLGLSLPPVNALQSDNMEEWRQNMPMPYFAIGRVADKEYCQARKDENRYRVNKGSKFYRIKLEPIAKRQSIRTFSTSSRSISQSESHSESAANNTSVLVPSALSGAAALRQSISASTVTLTDPMIKRDVVDYASLTAPIASTSAAAAGAKLSATASPTIGALLGDGNAAFLHKERTISIASSNDEDEPFSIVNDRCRYNIAGEEEDMPLAAPASGVSLKLTPTIDAQQQQQQQQQQSVITEQPTATSSKFQLELMLATVDAPKQQHDEMTTTLSSSYPSATSTAMELDAVTPASAEMATTSSMVAFGGAPSTSDQDSDQEYRSLEAKDDVDFAISE